MLRLSIRQVKRIWRRYKLEGALGLVSRQRGQPSNNRMHDEKRRFIITLLYAHYHDFGPTLAQEKLTETHHIRVSVETIRKLMIVEKLWRPRRVKKVRLHPMRQRRACLGELIQIDGSPHRWFEGRAPACTLLVFIDDATGRLMTLLFVPSETTFAYFEATRHYLLQHGKPIAFYGDRHSIFRVNTRNALSGTGLTQFGRVARDLGIEIICANTPQAKGRVERANQTLQDRLVKEMRLRGISSMEEGNAAVPDLRPLSKSSWTTLTHASLSPRVPPITPMSPSCPPRTWSISSPSKSHEPSPRTSPCNTKTLSTRYRQIGLPMRSVTQRSLYARISRETSGFSTRGNP